MYIKWNCTFESLFVCIFSTLHHITTQLIDVLCILHCFMITLLYYHIVLLSYSFVLIFQSARGMTSAINARGSHVYYIKKQAITTGSIYYTLLSTCITILQGSVLGCPKPVLGRTVPKTSFKPAFYCPKLSKTAQNHPKLSKIANWLRQYQIDTWTDIKFVRFKLSNAWKIN